MFPEIPRPKMPAYPSLRLVNHTIENLSGFTDVDVIDPSPLMTQWIISLSGILTLACEPLLEMSQLDDVRIGNEEYLRLGFPELHFIAQNSDHDCEFENLRSLLKFLRNGFAHGNTELIPGPWSQGKHNGIMRALMNSSLAGIAVWNTYQGIASESLVLRFHDISAFVKALGRLCNDMSYWNEDALSWSGEQVLKKYGW